MCTKGPMLGYVKYFISFLKENQGQILGWIVSYIPMQMVQAYKQTQAIVHGSFVDPQLHHNVVDYKTIQIVQEYKKFFPFKQYFIANKSKPMVYIYDLVFSQSIFLNTNSIYLFDEFFLY